MSFFTIKSVVNKETYKEIWWQLISKSEKICIAMVLFCALMAAIFFAVEGLYVFSFGAIVLALVLPLFFYRNIKKAVKLQFQRINESTGADELELDISFNVDKITIFCPMTNGTSFIEYKNLEKLVKTKNMYVLLTKARQFIAVDKAELAEKRKEFLRFVRSKMEK